MEITMVDTYSQLIASTDYDNILLVKEEPIRGFFYYERALGSPLPSDGGTIFEGTEEDGNWIRIFTGMPNAKWFNNPDDVGTASFYHAIKYAINGDVTLFIDDKEEYIYTPPALTETFSGKNLKLFGKGKIIGAASRPKFLFQPVEGSIVCIDGPHFSGFKRIIETRNINVNYEISIQNIRVTDCYSFIYSSSEYEENGCQKALIANCHFEDLRGRVIALKASDNHDITITNNVFKNIKSEDIAYVNVIDIGHGSLKQPVEVIELLTPSSRIIIAQNTFEDICFKDQSTAIFIGAAEQVVITENVLRNVRGVFDTVAGKLFDVVDGIYVKAVKCVISNNILHNAGTGEGAIKVKGIASFSTADFFGNARGHDVVISNNYVSYTPDFLLDNKAYVTGIMADGDRILVIGNQLNYVSTGIRATPGSVAAGDIIVGNTRIHSNQINTLFLHEDSSTNTGTVSKRVARGIFISGGFNNFSIMNNTIHGIVVHNAEEADKIEAYGIQLVDSGGDIHIAQNNFQDLHTSQGKAIMIEIQETVENFNISNNVFDNVKTCIHIFSKFGVPGTIKNSLFAQNVATNANKVFIVDPNTTYNNCKIANNQSDENCTWKYPAIDSFLSDSSVGVSGNYENGDILWRYEPALGENVAWVYVNGDWKSFGNIT